MKKGPALIAAIITTLLVGVIMVAVGINAFFNPTSVAAAQAPRQANVSGSSNISNVSTDTQVQQLQSLVKQYQAREQQYQDQLNQAKQQLQDASQQVQVYQSVLQQLQQIGLISIRDGQIFVRRGFTGGGDDNNSGSFFGGNSGSSSQPGSSIGSLTTGNGA
jgi:hypothetical protein